LRYIALAFDLVGAAAIVAGVSLLSVPAAFIVAGCLCVLLAAGLERRK
jgi:hypothetical protein